MGEEILGLVKAVCPSVEEFDGEKVGVGRCVGPHSHRSRRKGAGIGAFWVGVKWGKGKII